MPASQPPVEEVAAFLSRLHGRPVGRLEPLSGGFWSAAFGYREGDRDLVARFGSMREGFEADRDAMAFDSPGLPVPEVLDIGDAFGASYAISARATGVFLEDVSPGEAETTRPLLAGLLTALHAAPRPTCAAAAEGRSWRGYLLAGMADNPASPTAGWRSTLAADRVHDPLFRAAEARVLALLDACPERRDVVHGDLLHRNVLITPTNDRVNAVFSWKCSTFGDFLYDTAWCTFWSWFHPGIAAADAWRGIHKIPAMRDDLADAASRHHCYELQIGAAHLGWHTWTGEREELEATARHLAMVMERGPLSP